MHMRKSLLSFLSLALLWGSSIGFAIPQNNQLHRAGAVKINASSQTDGSAKANSNSEVAAEAASNASFEDAQKIGSDLAKILSESCSNGEPMPEEATMLLRALVSTTSGARGWFVTLLTTPEFEPVFQRPIDDAFLTALCDNPEPNIKLMTMNVAMPTATELQHMSMGNDEFAEGSRMTARRATILVEELLARLPGLRTTLEALLSAVSGSDEDGDEEWVKFCKKWGYGTEQKDAIRKKIEAILTK